MKVVKPLIPLTQNDIAKILEKLDDGWRSENCFVYEIRVILKCSDEAACAAFNLLVGDLEYDAESNPWIWRVKR